MRLLRAPLVADGQRVAAAPGVVLLEEDRVLASGTPEEVGGVPDARIEEHPGEAILPALVNAHCHLDLTHIGPLPPPANFQSWLEQVGSLRRVDPGGIEASVREGVDRTLAGGVAAVGDIAGAWSEVPLATLERSALSGVSFIELFGQGTREAAAVERLRASTERAGMRSPTCWRRVRRGVQPHAPYSCGLALYAGAAKAAKLLGTPAATHLAESPEEVEFACRRSGPFAEFLARLALLEEGASALGAHPLEALHAAGVLTEANWLLVHLNCLESHHVPLLAALRPTVVYCPRASAYFGHPRPGWSPHRYRELQEAGVRVALGTDSILCLDTPTRLSPLDDARLLWRRDGTEPRTLLAMITSLAAEALGLPADRFSFAAGESAGILAVGMNGPGLEGVMRASGPPRWLLAPMASSMARSAE
jgi:cytosine/adenosine deaminase-related metal-dependent hydrolase